MFQSCQLRTLEQFFSNLGDSRIGLVIAYCGVSLLAFDTMRLRDHPCMNHQSITHWPPTWVWIGGTRDKKPKGEVGLLQDVRRYEAGTNRCFLVIEHEQELYSGCLHMGNRLLCDRMFEALSEEIGQSIASIGALDIDTLWTLTRYGRCDGSSNTRQELDKAGTAISERTNSQVPPGPISATYTGHIYVDGIDGTPALQGSFTFAVSSKAGK